MCIQALCKNAAVCTVYFVLYTVLLNWQPKKDNLWSYNIHLSN